MPFNVNASLEANFYFFKIKFEELSLPEWGTMLSKVQHMRAFCIQWTNNKLYKLSYIPNTIAEENLF